MDYKDLCEKVCVVAKEAGYFISSERKKFSYDKVEFKGAQNLVSYVDKQTEILIVSKLKELLPDAGFITEEGTVEEAKDKRYKWIIDPLDGTTNFCHGLPPYCVSIALAEGNEIVVGVVYEVTLDECFWAWKGSEAYLNGEKIEVSTIDKLENALVATGFSYNSYDRFDSFARSMEYFMKHTNGARRIGSATADLVYVACGRFEGFAQFNLSAWDVAAGAFIAQRAGGVVSDFSGGDNYIFGREIIASNKVIYNDFKAIVNKTMG